MSDNTFGRCPICGKAEVTAYDDWKFVGYKTGTQWNGESVSLRVWQHVTGCNGLVTPDYDRTPDGNKWILGQAQAFVPR